MQNVVPYHNPDCIALDGIWREFISGVIFLRKANEFLDNKMVERSQGLIIGKCNHVFSSAQTQHPQIAMIARRFLRRKTFPWRRLTWKATVHFSTFCLGSVYVSVHGDGGGGCFFLYHEKEKVIQFSILLNRWKPNREFKTKTAKRLLNKATNKFWKWHNVSTM